MANVRTEGLAVIGSSAWIYPALEVLHILGIALLLGSLVLLELRVWGLGPELPPRALARLGMPVSVGGFLLIVASGSLMFSSQPGELLANRVFVWKMGLIATAGANAVFFHLRDGLIKLDALARVQIVLSLGLWVGAIICGRWIAYR